MKDPIRSAVCRYCGDPFLFRDDYCFGEVNGVRRARRGHAAAPRHVISDTKKVVSVAVQTFEEMFLE